MTPEECHTWSQYLQLSKETEGLMTAIRSSPPVRRVRGRTTNVTGRYPRPTMGRSIQCESEHGEFWAISGMERDDEVVEFDDQSSRIPLSSRASSGHKTTQWHTPDFFVLRTSSVGWEEWKPASVLDALAVSMPARYQQAGTGTWRCPPGEAYAAQFGLTYPWRSDAEHHPLEIQNLKFLQDFWADDVPPNPEQETLALAHIKAHPGIRRSELLSISPDLSVDILWTLMSQRRVLTDLSATLLMRHDQVTRYGEATAVNLARLSSALPSDVLPPSVPLAWDGRLWQIEAMTDPVRLRPEVGEPLLLSLAEVQHLRTIGSIWEVNEASPSPTTPARREALLHASPRAQQEAHRRLREMLAYARGEPVTTPLRRVRRWWHAYQEAETTSGCGSLGLLDRVAARGNRTPRLPEASRPWLDVSLQIHDAAPQAKSAAAVYRRYREPCAQQGMPPVSERTLYRVRARCTTTDVIATRRGRRAADASQPFSWLDQTTPRHGERPCALAHLDHTELDIARMSSVTGKPLGKPWGTLLTDANTRRILACYVTDDPPSYRSVMMAFRACVKRHQR